jgi:hypothetical protein
MLWPRGRPARYGSSARPRRENASLVSTWIIPLFLSIYLALVLGLVAWGYLRVRQSGCGDIIAEPCDGTLLGLLLLAAFTTGAFLAYITLAIG